MEVKNKTGAVTSCRGSDWHGCDFFGWTVLQIKKNVLTRDYIKKSIKDCKIKHQI
jgi:hypothetical protein